MQVICSDCRGRSECRAGVDSSSGFKACGQENARAETVRAMSRAIEGLGTFFRSVRGIMAKEYGGWDPVTYSI